jgi:hypothetical protein
MWQVQERRGEESVQGFGGKTRGKEATRTTEVYMVDWIRMDLKKTSCDCVERVQLVQDRDRWRILVIVEMNHRVLASRSYLARSKCV